MNKTFRNKMTSEKNIVKNIIRYKSPPTENPFGILYWLESSR